MSRSSQDTVNPDQHRASRALSGVRAAGWGCMVGRNPELLTQVFKQEWRHSRNPPATLGLQTWSDSSFLKLVSQLLGCFVAEDTPGVLGLCLALLVPPSK